MDQFFQFSSFQRIVSKVKMGMNRNLCRLGVMNVLNFKAVSNHNPMDLI